MPGTQLGFGQQPARRKLDLSAMTLLWLVNLTIDSCTAAPVATRSSVKKIAAMRDDVLFMLLSSIILYRAIP
jgi:hypothetical protein